MQAPKDLTEALRQAALAVSTAEGERVFDDLASALARILDVEFALISVYVEPQRTQLRTLAEHGIEGYAATTLHDAHGAPIGALSVMSRRELRDPALTEAMLKIFGARVGAEIERQRSAASYRAIFDNAESCIFVYDYETGAIVDVNPKACAVYGYRVEEMRRLAPDDLGSGVPPYTGADALRLIERARGGEVVRGEWHRRNKDGSLHWDEITLKKVELAGKPHILAVTREITARKETEEALRAVISRVTARMCGLPASSTFFSVISSQCRLPSLLRRCHSPRTTSPARARSMRRRASAPV